MRDINSRAAYYWRRLRAQYARLEDDRRLRRRFPASNFEDNVRVVSPHLLELGENVNVQRNTVLHCGGLDWSDGRGRISIGPNSIISANSILWGAGEIELGEGFECGPGCMIFSSAQDFMTREPEPVSAPLFFAPVKAGRYVSIYSGAIVSPGVTLGDGAVVAAGAVVVSDIPSREFWGGVPARRIRSLASWGA
jgi:acetyltransferase-like isoleucine patch superfamily enzyme